jgi:hypothetical protein
MSVAALVLLSACGDDTRIDPTVDAGPRDAGPVDSGPPPPPPRTSELDLPFMIDNSNSMTEEQQSLAAEMPELVSALVGAGYDSIQVGVVTSDMGVLGAAGVPTCGRADFGDDGVLRTQGRTDLTGCRASYPSFLTFTGGDARTFTNDVACQVSVGIGGCGFEQQLEAVLKAVSPALPTPWTAPGFVAPSFHAGSTPHGTGVNTGFVRADSVLAIVMLTDEEDCSAFDPELFDPTSSVYGGTDLNLRCFVHGEGAAHPISRFVDGLLQLRRSPGRLAFLPIVGVPVDLQPAAGAPVDWDRLVSDDPNLRDDRLEERVDPTMMNRLVPSCNTPGRGIAFPPVRILRVAQGLEARGARVTVGSICQESYATSFRAFAQQLAR